MPRKLKWGIALLSQMPFTYALRVAASALLQDRAHVLGSVVDVVLWLLIAAGWIGGPILLGLGLWDLRRQRRSAVAAVIFQPWSTIPPARGVPHAAEGDGDLLRGRLAEIGKLLAAGTITQPEHDALRQQALNGFAGDSR